MKKIDLTNTFTVGLLAVFCCLLWGSAFPCIKIGYQMFQIHSDDTAAQLLFAGCRFTLAGILTILFGSLLSKKMLVPKKESRIQIFYLCMVQTVLQYVLFYMGLAHTSGVKSSIVEASNVFIAILFAVFIFRFEKLTSQKVIGCALGFAGVVLINLAEGGLTGGFHLSGEGAILGSAAAYAFSAGLIKLYSRKENPVVLSGYQFILGGAIMVVIGYALGGRIHAESFTAVLLLFYMAMISAAAYTIWGILLKYNPVAKVSVYGFTNPMFGVLLSAIFLGEKNQAFGIRGIAALLLVCAGIYLVNMREKIKVMM